MFNRITRVSRTLPRAARALAGALCCLLAASSLAAAQGTRGTIGGTVVDQASAVVPGATVKLVDAAKQTEIRTVTTNAEGSYQFLELEPATYTVVVTAPSFAEATFTDVKVEPNRNVRLDVSLSVTGTAETVEVTAGDVLLDRETPTLGTTVENRRVEGLPLNGRNVLTLALLQPGVLPAEGGFGNGLGIRVNGSRGVENNITLDGSNNNEVAVGANTGATPRPDAIQEFRLLTSNYEAEFGRNTGSVINLVTKSGTNEYHGNARIFYRPTFLSAARFFDKANASPDQANDDLRRRFERKEFGGNIGGPVRIPWLYNGQDKTFFFVDYEGRRQLIGDTRTLTGLPTAAERMGDFSGLLDQGRTIRDPATGDPFPRNMIPSDRFSPIALFYLQFLPIPDASGRATVGANQITNNDDVTGRVDHNFSEKSSLNFTFNYFDSAVDSPFAFGGASVPGFGSEDLRTTYNYVVRHTYIISPTVVNSLLLGYARNNQPGVAPQNAVTPAEIGFTGNFVANETVAGPPYIQLLDRGLTLGNSIQGPQSRVTENFQIQDSVSWSKGDHRFKFGFDGTQYKQDQLFLFINQGIFTYSGRFGGNTTRDDLADFLIGNSPIALQLGANGDRDFRQKAVAFFAQDSWHVRPDLTLSLGVRYEYNSPLTDKYNRVAYYREGATSQLLTSGQLTDFEGRTLVVPAGQHAPLGLVYPGDPDPVLGGTVPDGGVAKDYNNFAPRLGFSWSPHYDSGFLGRILNGDTTVRGGFGVYYGAIIGDNALQQLNATGFNGTNSFFFPGSGTLADPFLPDPFPDYNGVQRQLVNPFTQSQLEIFAPLSQFATPIDPRIRTPYTYQYNFTIERAFLTDYVFSASYVGSRGLKLYSSQEINPSLGTFFPAPPGRVIPVPTSDNPDERRLNNDIQVGLNQLVSAGNSWYNALELNAQRRYSNGLVFQLAYTFSKAINDSDTQRDTLDILDRNAAKSLSSADAPHRFVGSWIWDIPFAKNTTGVFNRVLDGWSVGGIATFSSGTPFSVGNIFDTTGTSGVISLADLGAPYQQVDPRENDGRAFNVDAFKPFGDPEQGFVLATDFRRGTSGVNQFRLNNGINNWDLIFSKNTRLWGESSSLELRFEMFNAFNHTQFTGVDLNLNDIILDANGNPDPLKSSFGKYTSAAESRVIQLGARIRF